MFKMYKCKVECNNFISHTLYDQVHLVTEAVTMLHILTCALYRPIRKGEADSFYCNSQSSMLAKCQHSLYNVIVVHILSFLKKLF